MAKKHGPRFVQLVDAAKSRIPEVDVAQVLSMQSAGQALTLVDVREESEWAAGRIKGAIHLGKGILERDIEARVPDMETVLVLYCGGGFRSALAADSLHRMGYVHTVSLAGGWREWNAAGGPTE
jgi:rhodanese-related sulfurtransferase